MVDGPPGGLRDPRGVRSLARAAARRVAGTRACLPRSLEHWRLEMRRFLPVALVALAVSALAGSASAAVQTNEPYTGQTGIINRPPMDVGADQVSGTDGRLVQGTVEQHPEALVEPIRALAVAPGLPERLHVVGASTESKPAAVLEARDEPETQEVPVEKVPLGEEQGRFVLLGPLRPDDAHLRRKVVRDSAGLAPPVL